MIVGPARSRAFSLPPRGGEAIALVRLPGLGPGG